MINEIIVRSTLPNSELESEFYQLVVNHQLHMYCDIKHTEYYGNMALSIFEHVENWIYNNLMGPITEKIQNIISLSHS